MAITTRATVMAGSALLLSGGIGDFLHYICRIPAFLRLNGFSPPDVMICVESTVPDRVREIFYLSFPELQFCFTPGYIHWTRTNPLLNPHSNVERTNRPAYQYLRQLGFARIEDWFLPVACSEYEMETEILLRLMSDHHLTEQRLVVVAARDKGFLWWPSEQAFAVLAELLPSHIKTCVLGTPDEKRDWMWHVETPVRLKDALATSYRADLFVGTDTGLATIRELTGRKNIYCINDFWLEHMMVPFRYLDGPKPQNTASRFVTNLRELRRAIADHFQPDVGNRVPSSMSILG